MNSTDRIFGTVSEIEVLISEVNAIEGYPNSETGTLTWATPVITDDGMAEVPDKLPPRCQHLATHLNRRPRKMKEEPLPIPARK